MSDLRPSKPVDTKGPEVRIEDRPPSVGQPQFKSGGQSITVASLSATFRSPLPPPELMSEWERILPGSADRILSLTEGQSTHRQSLETITIRSDGRKSVAGIVCGTFLGTLVIALAAYMTYLGSPSVGATMVGAVLVAVVTAFAKAESGRREERVAKAKATAEISGVGKEIVPAPVVKKQSKK
jgi:uncharacterized membrane protein